MKINQEDKDEVVEDIEDGEEDEVDKALISLPLSAITAMNVDTFNTNVQRRRSRQGLITQKQMKKSY